MKPILEIKNISKEFSIRHELMPYHSFREKITDVLTLKKTASTERFLALKDVSFEVNEGDSIGIIGKNGAGKSTLLKILSKITPPSKGKVISRGRIASLLEVGTGFHPELTGRENVFLNGSILGMKRREIKSKFDEIVDFSGVEKFLDTPLKHYSSGMQLRLAFAVAAYLQPEILLLDEVLAVGDASFQRKCFQKMEDINSSGRTIILVSHNMSQIKQLCKKGVLLNKGQVVHTGDMQSTIASYVSESVRHNYIDVDSLPRAGIRSDELRIRNIKILNADDSLEITEGKNISLELVYQVHKNIEELVLGFSITDFYGNNIIECRSSSSIDKMNVVPGIYRATVSFNPDILPGTYNLNIGARSSKGHIEYVPSVTSIDILPLHHGFEEWNKPSAGIVNTKSNWTFNTLN